MAPTRAPQPSHHGGIGAAVPGHVDAVGHDDRLHPVVRSEDVLPDLADDKDLIRLQDCLNLTVDEDLAFEVVDVVDGADHPRRHSGVTDPGRSPS